MKTKDLLMIVGVVFIGFVLFRSGLPRDIPDIPILPTTTTTTTTVGDCLYRAQIGVKLKEVSYGNVYGASESSVDREIDDLQSLGVKIYSIHLNYQPYLKGDLREIKLVERAIDRIRSVGGILLITDAASESYRREPISWEQFKEAWRLRVADIATRYSPSYYAVVKEPLWYEQMLYGKNPARIISNEEWRSLIIDLTSIVKSKSGSTKTVVAVVSQLKEDQELVKMISDIPTLDIIGFDSYGSLGSWDKPLGDDSNLYAIEISLPYVAGKEVWITETGIAKAGVFEPDVKVQADWMIKATLFADSHNIRSVVHFYLSEFRGSSEIQDATKRTACAT